MPASLRRPNPSTEGSIKGDQRITPHRGGSITHRLKAKAVLASQGKALITTTKCCRITMQAGAGFEVETVSMASGMPATETEAPPQGLLPQELELARLIVSALSLEVAPEDIEPEAPLFNEGLGLDSIDALEIALAVSKAYNVKLRSDDERNHRIFTSLRSLTQHIEKNRDR
jgi:acyl carrier protein